MSTQLRSVWSAALALSCWPAVLCAAGAADAPPAVEVSSAWIRWLPADLPAGGYATLHNGGQRPQVLIGASSPDYAQVSLHHSSERDGVSLMQPVAQIELPAGGSLNFAVSGYHFMLEHPTRLLQPGDRVAITLRFGSGETETVWFELRRPDAGAPRP